MKIKLILICLLFSCSVFSQKLSPIEQYLLYNKVSFNLEMGKPVQKGNLEKIVTSSFLSLIRIRDIGYNLIPTQYKAIGVRMLEKCSAFGIFQEKKLKSMIDSNDYQLVRNCYLDSINPKELSLAAKSASRLAIDQYVRRLSGSFWRDSIGHKLYLKLVHQVDSVNYYQFISKLIDKGEFPYRAVLPLYLSDNTYPLFLHTTSQYLGKDSIKFEKYRRKIYQMVLEGRFNPVIYAIWVDRFYVFDLHSKYEIYGIFRDINLKPDEIPKVYDPKNLDKRRQAIGLMTTEQEIKLRLHRLAEKKENAQKKKSK